MSDLHHYITYRNYPAALRHLQQHPEEVTALDSRGNTALARLCYEGTHFNAAALSLAQALVNLRPQLMRDEPGLLHETSRLSGLGNPGSTDLALILISADPACVSERNSRGTTPFHSACGVDADIAVLRAMLEVNPALASQLTTQNHQSPLDILLRKNGWNLTGVALDKVALILLTTFKGRVMDPVPMNQLVHAVCCYPRPLTILTRMVRTFPEQASQPDDQGYLPLHYAVQKIDVWDNEDSPFLHSRFVFQKLMKLVRAAPQALLTVDPIDGLYPALMSATRAADSRLLLSATTSSCWLHLRS